MSFEPIQERYMPIVSIEFEIPILQQWYRQLSV
jgi:hypothetical protein